ncbi:MAG: hypothetical protein GF414_00115 [Candidatus Altiarchaeales archaeon]|nr:hypothetical protein [Candidatus Altiarchaeales archaeon]
MDYRYPLHVDEWHHIGEANNLAAGRYGFWSLAGFEIGYHAFLLSLEGLGFDLVSDYRFLPVLFAVAGAAALYLLSYRVTGDRMSSLFSLVFFSTLPTNVNLLGLWFATPLTFAIPLIYLSLYFFLRGVMDSEGRSLLVYCILLLMLLLSHPVSAFLVLIVSALHVLMDAGARTSLAQHRIYVVLVFLLMGFAAFSFMFLLGRDVGWFLSKLVFTSGWTALEPSATTNAHTYFLLDHNLSLSPYFLPLLFGLAPSILALTGIYHHIREGRTFFVAWVFYSASIMFLFVNFKISPLIPYQRMIYYCLMALAPLAGVGSSRVIRFLSAKLDGDRVTPTLAALLIMFSALYGYGSHPPGLGLYKLVDDSDVEALGFLRKMPYGPAIADLKHAIAVHAIADKSVPATLVFIGNERSRGDVREFYASNCTVKEEIANRYKTRYVYSEEKIACDGFREVYSDDRFIYDLR